MNLHELIRDEDKSFFVGMFEMVGQSKDLLHKVFERYTFDEPFSDEEITSNSSLGFEDFPAEQKLMCYILFKTGELREDTNPFMDWGPAEETVNHLWGVYEDLGGDFNNLFKVPMTDAQIDYMFKTIFISHDGVDSIVWCLKSFMQLTDSSELFSGLVIPTCKYTDSRFDLLTKLVAEKEAARVKVLD